MNIKEQKKQLRQVILKQRADLSRPERDEQSARVVSILSGLEQVAACKTILAFYPFRDEVDIRPFLAAARERGQEVWLPLTDPAERKIIPYHFSSEAVLRQGFYGITEPDPALARAADVSRLEAVIVPGVAFDRAGGRLGYGGGYYDRFLSRLPQRPLLIGAAFSCQLVEDLPTEPHDHRLDLLVTERGILGPFVSDN